MNAIPTDKNTILRLVDKVTKGQKQSDTNEEKTNSSEIKLVNGVDVAPACPPTDTDKERLKQKVAQLFQP